MERPFGEPSNCLHVALNSSLGSSYNSVLHGLPQGIKSFATSLLLSLSSPPLPLVLTKKINRKLPKEIEIH